MKGKKIDYEDEFYCTQCGGRQQFRIPRPVNQARATGHLKKMYCFNCNKEVNFVECKPYAVKYNHNDFLLEFYGKMEIVNKNIVNLKIMYIVF